MMRCGIISDGFLSFVTRNIPHALCVLLRLQCLVALLLLPLPGVASPLVLSDDMLRLSPPKPLLPYVEVLEDISGDLQLEDVLSGHYETQFKHHPGELLDLHYSPSAYWVRFEILNQSKLEEWFLDFVGSTLSVEMVLYMASGNSGKFIELNQSRKTRGLKYRLDLARNTPYAIYFRIRDTHTPLVIWPELYSSSQILNEVKTIYPLYSFILGGLLILALYNLIYFTVLRDKSFLVLCIFTVAFTMELSNLSGLLHYFEFFRDKSIFVGGTFTFIIICGALSLTEDLLSLRERLPKLLPWYRFGFWLSFCGVLVSHMLVFGTGIGALGGLLCMFLVLITIVMILRNGYAIPGSLVAAAFFICVGASPLLLRGMGIIGHSPEMFVALFSALLIALIFLSFAQAERVRLLRENAERTMAAGRAKDEFLVTMSHELRTPMNAIVGAGGLMESTNLSHRQERYISRLNTASRHMLSLVNDILDLAQIDNDRLKMEASIFGLGEILEKIELLVKNEAQEKQLILIVENNFQDSGKKLCGDEIRLKQILLNLMHNAVKFTHRGEVRLCISPRKITARSVRLFFEVSDTGTGIAEDKRSEMFQPFVQADNTVKRKYGGSGLGLAISSRLVKHMGGKLDYTSVSGKGSRFFFTLDFPLTAANNHNNMTVDDKGGEAFKSLPLTLSDISVLLVDDDEINLFLGREQLELLGAKVTVAESGAEAILCLRRARFDLVFMDVSMPGMDGREATQRIRILQPGDLVIVALTAHSLVGEKERCLAAGMNDYMTKPFEQADLKNMIVKWLSHRNESLPERKL